MTIEVIRIQGNKPSEPLKEFSRYKNKDMLIKRSIKRLISIQKYCQDRPVDQAYTLSKADHKLLLAFPKRTILSAIAVNYLPFAFSLLQFIRWSQWGRRNNIRDVPVEEISWLLVYGREIKTILPINTSLGPSSTYRGTDLNKGTRIIVS